MRGRLSKMMGSRPSLVRSTNCPPYSGCAPRMESRVPRMPAVEKSRFAHVEIATNEVANEAAFTFGIVWRGLIVGRPVRYATADDAARMRLPHRECVARIQAADVRADRAPQTGCVV